MDNRQVLIAGSKIVDSSGTEYEIKQEVGRGASCIVYDGQFKDSLNNFHHIRVKEFYPYDLEIYRDDSHALIIPKDKKENFESASKKFVDTYRRNVELHNTFGIVNSTVTPQNLFEFGNTWYMISACVEGVNYKEFVDQDIRFIFRKIRTISILIQKYHKEGYLYLDLKPENIFVIPETDEHIMLFDFDSIILKKELDNDNKRRISFSRGYAAPELARSNRNKICEATDIYSIGAIAFEKVFGRVPSVMDGSVSNHYSYDAMVFERKQYSVTLFKYLSEFFHKTLSSSVGYRYQSVDELLPIIDKIIKYSDLNAQYLLENFSYSSANFIGRNHELLEIEQRLHGADIVFLSGIGGIGKTELAKKYASCNREQYSKIVFLPFQNTIKETICSEELSFQNLNRDEDTENDYFTRKINALKKETEELEDNHPILLILDNFDVDGDDDLEILLNCGCKIIVTTRNDFSDYDYPQIDIESMDVCEDLRALFHSYNSINYSDEENAAVCDLFELVDRHTMTIALLAKYLKESLESPLVLKEKFIQLGGMSNTEEDVLVKHRKDKRHKNKNIMTHLRILFDVSGITDIEKEIMRSLSLLGYVRINRTMLLELLNGLGRMEELDTLIRHGWIEYDVNSEKISLHQVILDLVYDQLCPVSENCPNLMEGFYRYIQKPTESDYERQMNRKLCDILFERLKGHDYRYARFCVWKKRRLDEAEQICRMAVEKNKYDSKFYFLLAQIMKVKAFRIGENTDDYYDQMIESSDDQFDMHYMEKKCNELVAVVQQEINYVRKATDQSEILVEYFMEIVKDLDSFFETLSMTYMDEDTYQIILSVQLELLDEVGLLLLDPEIEDESRLKYLVKIRDFYGSTLMSMDFSMSDVEHYSDLKKTIKYQKQINELRDKLYSDTIYVDSNDLSLPECREDALDLEDLEDLENIMEEELSDEDDILVLGNLIKLIAMYKNAGKNNEAIEKCKLFIEIQNQNASENAKSDGKSWKHRLFVDSSNLDDTIGWEETLQVYDTLAELLIHENNVDEARFYLDEALLKIPDTEEAAESFGMIYIIQIYDLLVQISDGTERSKAKEGLEKYFKQYFHQAQELSEQLSYLIVKYIEKVPETERVKVLEDALRRYSPCCVDYVWLPENDLLFQYAENMYETEGNTEKLFELLVYHVKILQKRFASEPGEEQLALLKRMERILSKHSCM